MHIGIATDAWYPQVNGVVTTLSQIEGNIKKELGIECTVISPNDSKYKFSAYDNLKLGFSTKYEKCDAYYIATPEGPVGYFAKLFCLDNFIPFITGFHTDWVKYGKIHYKIPNILTTSYLKWVHRHSHKILVPTPSIKNYVEGLGFKQKVKVLSRGVNHSIFKLNTFGVKNRIVCVSRISKEKGLDDFCKIKLPGFEKVLIGDGPYLQTLQRTYSDVTFTGYLPHDKIAKEVGESSVFIFPSKSDTFGLVMLEAMACGTPVVGYNVAGPVDVIEPGINGIIADNLENGVIEATKLNRVIVHESTLKYQWSRVALDFLNEVFLID